MRVLVVNAGSQTLKLRVIGEQDAVEAATDIDARDGYGTDELRTFVEEAGAVDVTGHRVVHGGDRFNRAVMIDPGMRHSLDALNELAPLHNPPALRGIDAVRALLPSTPAVACFDTAFHAGLPAAAATYALPHDWVTRWGIRRYGFHGLSCSWAASRSQELLAEAPGGRRLVVCHLGGGASVTAVADGRSVDTTMGFTPLEGLVMATRSGDVDPGALLWVLRRGLLPAEADNDLERRAGLLGLSGDRTSDMRELVSLRDAGDEQAQLAIAVYVHRLRAKIAAMAAALGGLDTLVFTGGVGENASVIRSEICAGLGWMGVDVDDAANAAAVGCDGDISAPGSAVRTFVVHAREDSPDRP